MDSAMAAVSTLSALSTRLINAPVTMLSAMTPEAVKVALSTVAAHQAHSSRNWLPRTSTGITSWTQQCFQQYRPSPVRAVPALHTSANRLCQHALGYDPPGGEGSHR